MSDVLNLYLKLGPDKAIDMRFQQNGYSRLLSSIKKGFNLSEFLGLGADLHLVGLDTSHSPYWESPTTLAMYSSRSFANWRAFLEQSELDIGEFIECELERGPLAELGWTSDALCKLFQWDFEREYDLDWTLCCPDCKLITICPVQPAFREQLNKIKKDIHGGHVANARKNADQGSSINISDMHLQGADTISEAKVLGSQREDTENAAGSASMMVPVEDGTEELLSEGPAASERCEECSYKKNEQVCIDCWLYYEETGHRYGKHTTEEEKEEEEEMYGTDNPSEDDFSPFHIHT